VKGVGENNSDVVDISIYITMIIERVFFVGRLGDSLPPSAVL
jgi:hypothetical protein